MTTAKDLTGQTFGYWIVVKYAGVNKYRKSLWTCQCRCGVVRDVCRNSLISNISHSCGCFSKGKNSSNYKHGESVKGKWTTRYGMWTRAKERAKRLKLTFDLELEDVIVPEICPVLGTKLEVGKEWVHDRSPSIDRIVPNKGYTKDNCIVVSCRSNRIKNNATIEELEKVVNFYKDKTNEQDKSGIKEIEAWYKELDAEEHY